MALFIIIRIRPLLESMRRLNFNCSDAFPSSVSVWEQNFFSLLVALWNILRDKIEESSIITESLSLWKL